MCGVVPEEIVAVVCGVPEEIVVVVCGVVPEEIVVVVCGVPEEIDVCVELGDVVVERMGGDGLCRLEILMNRQLK